jgi:hypothetical protein
MTKLLKNAVRVRVQSNMLSHFDHILFSYFNARKKVVQCGSYSYVLLNKLQSVGAGMIQQ